MTVEELGQRMSASEFVHWMAYMELDPFGSEREDWRAAQICSALCGKPVSDFMFKPPEPLPVISSAEEFKAFLLGGR